MKIMKIITKIIIAALGAINVVFSILIPISVALLLISVGDFNDLNVTIIIITGMLSSLYRAIDVGFLS